MSEQRFTRYTLEELRTQAAEYANRHHRAPAITDLADGPRRTGSVELRQAVQGFEVMQTINIARPLPQVLPYRDPRQDVIDGRRLFAYILEQVEDNISKNSRQTFRFQWTPAQAEVIQALIKHAINDPSGPIPINKGWYLWGDTQKGKTTLAKTIQALHLNIAAFRKRSSPKEFKFTDVQSMYQHFEEQEKVKIDPYLQYDRLFDDVGCKKEWDGLVMYGQHRDPMAEILWQRHRSWQEFGRLTYMTSNLPFESIRTPQNGTVQGWLTRFDERIQARLRDMVHPILFPS